MQRSWNLRTARAITQWTDSLTLLLSLSQTQAGASSISAQSAARGLRDVWSSPELYYHQGSAPSDYGRQLLSRLAPGKKGSFAACTSSFDGTKDAEVVKAFLSAITVYKTIENISDADSLIGIPLLLKGEAAVWWQGVKNDVKQWEEFKNRLRHVFAPKKPAYLIYQEIVGDKQNPDMSTESFVAHKRMLFTQLPTEHSEIQQLDMVFGQLNIKIKEKIPRNSIANFDQLLEAARGVEQLYEDIGTRDHLNDKLTPNAYNHGNVAASMAASQRKKKCSFCHLKGHTAADCRKLKRRQSELPVPETPHQNIKTTQAPSPSQPKFSCYGCGAPGVVRSNCNTCTSIKRRPSQAADISFCAVNVNRTDSRPRPVVFVEIVGIKGTAHIDTCAKTSVASYNLYRQLLARGVAFHKEIVNLTLADGISKTREVLQTRVPVTLEHRVIGTTFIVLPESKDNRTLLGIGFIQDAKMVLNLPQFTWEFLDDDRIYELFKEDFATFPEVHISSTAVPQLPMETQIKPAVRPKRPMTPKEAAIPEESASTSRYKLIPIARTPTKKSKPLFDGYSPRFCDFIMKDAEINVREAESSLSPHSQQLFPDQINVNIDSIDVTPSLLSTEEVSKLNKLLDKYDDVFTTKHKPSLLGEHAIITNTDRPISVPPYRLSANSKNILKQEIDKMLKIGVIEPCSSPWAAPVVLVPKPNGEISVCVDYRRLNDITVGDTYPLPRIDDLLHAAKPTPYMSSLDLKAGYWQIKIKEEDEDKTAFITPFGIYKFKRMPFGLRNAPATFQRLIDRFRVNLEHIKMLAYLDDLIIFSSTFNDHLKDLRDVLEKMRENNLTINREKSRFFCSSLKYLGHIITPDGLKTNPEKTSAITNLLTPKNIKDLTTFL
ncbi:uncharacterized protein LOC113238882 [Hyposmocoma kahamanoa]|uniref:uncharacterized protein LOC113238882 n=1 Tax=Hyposmocoma kahamanoa TaxID=1477025 RepID=UPI000E6D78BB|nr:uncharacterized protein LOC113238882 [Hyposmocoma kahamanoa]